MQKYNFSYVFLNLYPTLKMYSVKFGYQNKNSKKHGHFKKKTNRTTLISTYEIKIEKDDSDAAKIYTFIHEFTHFFNNHIDKKEITSPQKEYVAHTVAMDIINTLDLYTELKQSKLSKKWNIDSYATMWMKNRKTNERQKEIMEKQVKNTIKYIKKALNT